MPHNSTQGDPAASYADLVPPYPLGFDFETEDTPAPSYESLDYTETQGGAAWQAWDDGWELGDQPPMPQDRCRCPDDAVGVMAVTFQLAVLLAWLYGDLGKYSPFGMR